MPIGSLHSEYVVMHHGLMWAVGILITFQRPLTICLPWGLSRDAVKESICIQAQGIQHHRDLLTPSDREYWEQFIKRKYIGAIQMTQEKNFLQCIGIKYLINCFTEDELPIFMKYLTKIILRLLLHLHELFTVTDMVQAQCFNLSYNSYTLCHPGLNISTDNCLVPAMH